MNTATYPQKWQPRAWWTVLMRGLAPSAVMAAAVGLLMGSPASSVLAPVVAGRRKRWTGASPAPQV
jgi:hypothetical protein